MMLEERRLASSDIDACMRLVAEAGWNQTENDWKTIFKIGEGRGLFDDGMLVASAAIVRYGPIGWVCMVLVTQSHQRRGLATRLLNWAGDRLEELGLTAGLDATPAGRHVYLRLGYEDIYPITRMQADEPTRPSAADASSSLRPIGKAEIELVTTLDRRAFGADRRPLLESLAGRRPDIAMAAFEGVECLGFVLGREGRRATQIGPLVARGEAIAEDLLRGALARTHGPVFIDIPDRHQPLRACLEEHGFSPQRAFTRMLRGRADPFDDDAVIFALTGPEFA